jgi:hypothetical protein
MEELADVSSGPEYVVTRRLTSVQAPVVNIKIAGDRDPPPPPPRRLIRDALCEDGVHQVLLPDEETELILDDQS